MGNYLVPGDISSWPSGISDADKVKTINFAEQLIEKILGRHFYVKNFDIELNGNGKNRLFIPLYADIITVDQVDICGVTLSTDMYDYDENSIYLNICGSAASQSGYPWAELAYKAGEYWDKGLFPHGYNNVRVIGTFGEGVPEPIKKAVEYLIDAINEGTFGTGAGGLFKSEKIGDYSYTTGLVGYWKSGVLTGVDKADTILRHYVKQKKPIILAP